MKTNELSKALKANNARRDPPWTGPGGEGPNGGVTQGLIRRFLRCREQFRLYVVEGLAPVESFSHRLEYGSMWHVCEHAHAGHDAVASKGLAGKVLADNFWKARLQDHVTKLMGRHPLQREEIDKWHQLCRRQFPLYVEHWANHPDVLDRRPVLQEHAFDVPYQLPSGRAVRLRGRFDSVDLVRNVSKPGTKCAYDRGGLWLQENKTKGDIDEQLMCRRLAFDLQTNLYAVALIESDIEQVPAAPFRGVRYNVVRRPLSGGKGTVVRLKEKRLKKGVRPAETREHYYDRVMRYVKDDSDHWFMRWTVPLSADDVARFRRQCLDPVLEQMCDWWSWVSDNVRTGKEEIDTSSRMSSPHWRTPFGVLRDDDSGDPEYEYYLTNGSTAGLRRIATVFPELNEVDHAQGG